MSVRPVPSSTQARPSPPYIGRFAPSPSGPLHFGSLVCALASFLDARAAGGQWLLRIEDIDPPREQPGASASILARLERHHLLWDAPPLLQSTRGEAYRAALRALDERGLCYRCDCNRKRLSTLGGGYDGRCRDRAVRARRAALRLNLAALPFVAETDFSDAVQGPQAQNPATAGDFVIHRKDGLFAYQLAVVVDDLAQGITHVVRGADLLDTTARHRLLMRALGADPTALPVYAHIPLVLDEHGAKMSKQNHAAPLDDRRPAENLWRALHFLGFDPPAALARENPAQLLQWGVQHWNIRAVSPTNAALARPE